MAEIETHPVQDGRNRLQAEAPKTVTMAAYEVYCHKYAPQEAMVTGGCRGGSGYHVKPDTPASDTTEEETQ